MSFEHDILFSLKKMTLVPPHGPPTLTLGLSPKKRFVKNYDFTLLALSVVLTINVGRRNDFTSSLVLSPIPPVPLSQTIQAP